MGLWLYNQMISMVWLNASSSLNLAEFKVLLNLMDGGVDEKGDLNWESVILFQSVGFKQ